MTQPTQFTDSTPRFKLPFLFGGQAQKEFFVNEAHALADILLHTAINGEASVPPANVVEGDIWLVASGATGAWAGRDGQIAGLQAGVWKFAAPTDGMQIFDKDTGQIVIRSGDWIRATPPANPDSGQTIDSELRVAFGQLIEALRNAGIFSASE